MWTDWKHLIHSNRGWEQGTEPKAEPNPSFYCLPEPELGWPPFLSNFSQSQSLNFTLLRTRLQPNPASNPCIASIYTLKVSNRDSEPELEFKLEPKPEASLSPGFEQFVPESELEPEFLPAQKPAPNPAPNPCITPALKRKAFLTWKILWKIMQVAFNKRIHPIHP